MRPETQKQQTAASSRKDLRDLCEGNRVLIEVKIFQDWTFVEHVNGLRCLKQVSLVQRLPRLASLAVRFATR